MRSTICKSFTFHAAHAIPHHQGKCRILHGHTYRADIYVAGAVQRDGPEMGMVRDFDAIKDAWAAIEPKLDHQNLNDTLIPEIPATTAEHIAGWIRRHMSYRVLGIVEVRVWETPTSWASVTVDDSGIFDRPTIYDLDAPDAA